MNEYDNQVSVIIPFYENKDWLLEALESINNQTVKPLEVIIINDGSKENIDDIQNIYSWIKLINQNNQGAGAARNVGIQFAKAKYIAFLDSDDLWDSKKIEMQLKSLLKTKRFWSATGYKTFGKGKVISVSPEKKANNCYDLLCNSCKIQTSTVMIETKILKDDPNARFAEDMRNGQDIYLWFYLANKFDLVILDETLTYYRIRGGNVHLHVNAHIRVRAQLWKKMKDGKLPLPKYFITRCGYTICDWIFNSFDCKKDESIYMKILFSFAWILFRIGRLLVKFNF